MATIKAGAAGDWSAVGTWVGGVVPAAGDTVDFDGFVVALDVATIPATGTLAAIGSPAKVGGMTINMAVLGDVVINATTITCGTIASTGLLAVSGATPTKVLTINGNIIGGTATNAWCLVSTTTAGIVINGSVTGGSGAASYGLYENANGVVTVNGVVTGGSDNLSYGVYRLYGVITVNGNVVGGSYPTAVGLMSGGSSAAKDVINGNLICNSALPISWRTPTWTPGSSGYIEIGGVKYRKATRNLVSGGMVS